MFSNLKKKNLLIYGARDIRQEFYVEVRIKQPAEKWIQEMRLAGQGIT